MTRQSPFDASALSRAAVLAFPLVVACHRIARAAAPTDDDVAPPPVRAQVDTALHSVLLIGGVLGVVILAAVAYMVIRKAMATAPVEAPTLAAPRAPTPSSPATVPTGDPATYQLDQAAAEERRGNFTGAASLYEAAEEPLRAAECWEKAKDFARAAEAFEAAEEYGRAAQAYLRSGGALRAAGAYMRMKNYIEAAKIFRNKGDHLRAGQALELFGNKLAAAREYTAAGQHALAARLLEEERRADAARAARQAPPAAGAHAAHAAAHVAHPATHATPPATAPAGAAPQPAPLRVAPDEVDFVDLEAAPVAPVEASAPPQLSPEEIARGIEADHAAGAADPLHRVFTLRSMIDAGRMEPRYSMRLWVQAMRALADRHRTSAVYGGLTPDSVAIDMENNIRLERVPSPPAAYVSPEVRAGRPADRQADVYAMGVILYELVCGSLEKFGAARASAQFADIPSWLDELIERCTEPDAAKRFHTTEEVSAALIRLKSAAQES
jgi:tetratricopeptide (TPR) repeat protein